MKKSIDFFYRVAKEAGFAEDEDGNPSDCYLKIGFNLKKPVSAEKIEAEREKNERRCLKSCCRVPEHRCFTIKHSLRGRISHRNRRRLIYKN